MTDLLADLTLLLDAVSLLSGKLQDAGPNEVVMWKPRWSAFHRTPLERHLSALGIDTVVVAECNFPNCPRATIFDASERDFRVVIATDAVSQTTPERLGATLKQLVLARCQPPIADSVTSTPRLRPVPSRHKSTFMCHVLAQAAPSAVETII